MQQGETLSTEPRQVPMVDLPLGATEDRLCGTIDIEKALSEGVRAFEPGLLAKANRGLLYVDEVNLLDDHLARVSQLQRGKVNLLLSKCYRDEMLAFFRNASINSKFRKALTGRFSKMHFVIASGLWPLVKLWVDYVFTPFFTLYPKNRGGEVNLVKIKNT